jgi:hypothetical protein
MLLLEVLARRVLSHHIICDENTGSSTSSSSSSQRSSSGARLWQQLLQCLSGVQPNDSHCLLAALMSVPANHPELLPGLLALLASLHKLSRQQSIGSQLSVAEAAATYAKSVIHKFSDLGIPSLVDLATLRAMVAPWVVIIGLYCCELGRWLQRWQRGHLRALQKPKSPICRSKAAADAVLLQFEQFNYAAQDIIGCPELQRVSDLWESGFDSSSSSSGVPGDAGAALVDEWQRWRSGGQQQQERQQLADAAAAGMEAPAATAAAGVHAVAAAAADGEQSAAAPSGEQPPPPQQQQQVLVPAYGSLGEEFSKLDSNAMCEYEDMWHVVRHTRKHLKSCAKAQPRSSCSSDDSDSDGLSSEEDGSDVGKFHWDQEVAAAQRRVKEASSIQSSMQACLEYEGFTYLAEMLQEVGEAICAKVPVPWMCNNPGCTRMEGASELHLVGGKACVCGGCRVAR